MTPHRLPWLLLFALLSTCNPAYAQERPAVPNVGYLLVRIDFARRSGVADAVTPIQRFADQESCLMARRALDHEEWKPYARVAEEYEKRGRQFSMQISHDYDCRVWWFESERK